MKMYKKSIIKLILIAFFPFYSHAQDSCIPKNINVCKIAHQIATDMAARFPIRLNQNLVMQTVFSSGRMITMNAKFEYNKAFLDESLIAGGMTNSQMINIMREHSRSTMCAGNKATRNFITQGGEVRYIYRFNDGSIYTTIDIISC